MKSAIAVEDLIEAILPLLDGVRGPGSSDNYEAKGCGIAYVVEGNRDWLALAAHGWPAVGILGTEHFAKAREESFEHIRAAGIGALVITPDNDEPGRDAARAWARVLSRDGFVVGIRMLPSRVNSRAVKDLFDLFHATGEAFEGWLHEMPIDWREQWG